MLIFYILFIAFALSMDAFAVSITCGMTNKGSKLRFGLKVGMIFGIFQGVMFLIGWWGGELTREIISRYAPAIAFVLLTLLGLRMINEARKNWNSGKECKSPSNGDLLLMGLATSIDALVVGLTFGVLGMNILIPALVIFAITFWISFLGIEIGHRMKGNLDKWAEIIGGIVLILISFKILVEGFL
jgi:putative Mn2+ efflux pump MntP